MDWLPEPPPGSAVCLGFDGSDVDDWTALRAETLEGFQFTPRYGPDRLPTIWNPSEWGGKVPRDQVDVAVAEIHERFRVERGYYDPPRWETDVDRWSLRHGETRVIAWETYRTKQMHEALERFVVDLASGRIRQDGCPLTAINMRNARKVAKAADRYILAKPSQAQKIDIVMASVMAHEAAADARVAGWGNETDNRMFVFR